MHRPGEAAQTRTFHPRTPAADVNLAGSSFLLLPRAQLTTFPSGPRTVRPSGVLGIGVGRLVCVRLVLSFPGVEQVARVRNLRRPPWAYTPVLTPRTRWTLTVCFKFLPWRPVWRFTGISDYTLDSKARVMKQVDYWDSINLMDGERGGVRTRPARPVMACYGEPHGHILHRLLARRPPDSLAALRSFSIFRPQVLRRKVVVRS